MASWVWSTPTLLMSIPLVRSTADRDRMQIEDLRGVEDPRYLNLFRQVLLSHQLLHETLFSPYPEPGYGEMVPPAGVADPADLHHPLLLPVRQLIQLAVV